MKRIFLLTFCLLTVCAMHADETTVKVRKAVGRWEVSGDLSMAEAEERALNEAKKDALSKAGVMENVWSVFGQVTSDNGTEFAEAYSSVSILAMNGLVNVTSKEVEDLWDPVARKFFKVVTIDATVTKSDIREDRSYVLEVNGIEPVYKESDLFRCSLKVHGADSYVKFFWFGDSGADMIYPNEYEGNQLFKAGKTYDFPLTDAVEMVMSKADAKAEVEKVNVIVVATKKDYPYIGEKDYLSILSWIFNLPADQRTLYYHMTLIK